MPTLLDQIEEAVWAVDLAYRILYANQQIRTFMEVLTSRAFLLGQSIFYPELSTEQRAIWQGYYDRALRGEIHSVEVVGQADHLPGAREYRFQPMRAADGAIIGVIVVRSDITARHTAEQALRASEERFRASVENMLDSFGIYSAIRAVDGTIVDFRIDYVNEAACVSTQLSREAQIGHRLLEVRPGHRESGLFAAYCDLVNTGIPLSRESLAYTNHDGDLLLSHAFDIRASRFGDGFIASWRDITPRKQAELQLAASQNFIERITELLPAGIYIFDIKAQQNIYTNRHIANLLGYAPDEIQALGEQFVATLLHPDDHPQFTHLLDAMRSAEDGQIVENEYRFRHRDGSWRWMRSRETVFRRDEAGQVWQTVGFVEDITDRRILYDRVHYQANLLAQITDAVIATDSESRISSWNTAAERIYGWSAAQALGRKLPELIETRYIAESEEDVERALLRNDTWSGEVEQRRADGTLTAIQSIVSLLRDQYGKPTGTVRVNRDISDRRHSEHLLQAANTRLEQAILDARRRTSEVVQINQMHDLLQVCQNRRETAEVIGICLAALFPEHRGYLAVRQPGAHRVEVLGHWGGAPPLRLTFGLDACWALRLGQLHIVKPDHDAPRCQHTAESSAICHCCLPLAVQGELYGVLSVAGTHEPPIELLLSVGDAIKLALANIDLREALREQATHDPLTGLFNRRYLEASLPRELHRVQREGDPLCVVMIDIDHFKRFNDRYGHEAGDILLREVAWVFRDGIRRSDIACRYGGEEFLLVLPGSSLAETRTRVEAMAMLIRTLRIDYLGRRLDPVTISVGLAARQHHESMAELIRAADEALYLAKAGGRDQLVVAERNMADF